MSRTLLEWKVQVTGRVHHNGCARVSWEAGVFDIPNDRPVHLLTAAEVLAEKLRKDGEWGRLALHDELVLSIRRVKPGEQALVAEVAP